MGGKDKYMYCIPSTGAKQTGGYSLSASAVKNPLFFQASC